MSGMTSIHVDPMLVNRRDGIRRSSEEHAYITDLQLGSYYILVYRGSVIPIRPYARRQRPVCAGSLPSALPSLCCNVLSLKYESLLRAQGLEEELCPVSYETGRAQRVVIWRVMTSIWPILPNTIRCCSVL